MVRMAKAPFGVPSGRLGRRIGFRDALIGAAAALLATALPPHDAARAQGRSPVIAVAPMIAAEPSVETPLPIRISPPEAVPRQSFLRIQGLPRTLSLSDGHSIAPGAWAVPLTALPNLRMSTPTGTAGRSEVTISLIAADGVVLAEARVTLLIAPAGQGTAKAQEDAVGPEPPP